MVKASQKPNILMSGYSLLKAQEALKRLKDIETLHPAA